jgi:hypothetical protein
MIYVNQKDSQEENCTKPRETVWIESTQIRWLLGQSDRRLTVLLVAGGTQN